MHANIFCFLKFLCAYCVYKYKHAFTSCINLITRVLRVYNCMSVYYNTNDRDVIAIIDNV